MIKLVIKAVLKKNELRVKLTCNVHNPHILILNVFLFYSFEKIVLYLKICN